MPLASAIPDMRSAMQSVQDTMHASDGELPHVGEQWATVAEAFFKNGLNPAWTPMGLAAGRAAFAASFGASVPASLTPNAFCAKLISGFQAFGALAASPTNAAPGLPAQLIPITPPPAPPVIVTIAAAPSDSFVPLLIEIHPKLVSWAATGLVSVTTPGGPVPTTPWS